MKKAIRVLQVIGSMNCGGAENMIMNLYRKFDRTKIQFDFLVHTNEKGFFDDEINEMGGRIYHIDRCSFNNIPSYYKNCLKFFENHSEYKVVHGHIGSSAAWYLSAAKKCGCYTIAHSHSTDKNLSLKKVFFKIASYPTRYIADSFFGCSTEAGKSRYGSRIIKSEIYRNFSNAIDTDKFLYNEVFRDDIRKEFGVLDDEILIGTVGRISFPKNPGVLYEIFKNIVLKEPKAKCLWVGKGEFSEKISSMIKEDKLEKKIIMAGVRNDVYKLIQGMDCMLFPSLWEGLPVSVIEAQASGLPCILSDTISPEAEITGLIKWQSLAEPVDVWADSCIQTAKASRSERKSPTEDIKKAGYDINDTVKRLTDFYLLKSGGK